MTNLTEMLHTDWRILRTQCCQKITLLYRRIIFSEQRAGRLKRILFLSYVYFPKDVRGPSQEWDHQTFANGPARPTARPGDDRPNPSARDSSNWFESISLVGRGRGG